MLCRKTPLALAITAVCSFSHAVAADGKTLLLEPQTIHGLADSQSADGYQAPPSSAATRLSLTPRQTPQSVSTITAAQLDDFKLSSVNQALKYTPGISVEEIETDRTYFTARGFDITNFQHDGVGLPLVSGNLEGSLDTAPFERIEVLRGANGLMSGTGNPSATINFVRKRPTFEPQAAVDLTVGSWGKRRIDTDVSGALTESGNLRGRLVYANETGNSHLDRYSREKNVFSAILEADLGDNTLLAIGHSLNKSAANSPMWGALPLFDSAGGSTGLSRSSSTAADWAWWDSQENRSFAELTHRFDNGWQAKGTLTYVKQESESELLYVYGTPDASTGLGLYAYPSQYEAENTQWIGDVSLSGPFSLGGREHELVLGANAYQSTLDDVSHYGRGIGNALPPIQGWHGDYPKPPFDAGTAGSSYEDTQQSVYSAARFSLTDQLAFIAGARAIELETEGTAYGLDRTRQNDALLPYAGLVYDLNEQYSVYASYTEIFNPQKETDASHDRLDPIEGQNYEVGVKGELLDGALNVSAAVFKTKQSNVAESAGFDAGSGQLTYAGTDFLSEGYELEVSGEILPGWQALAGYSYVDIQNADHSHGRAYVPKHMLRGSTTYRVPGLEALKVGANLSWQDAIYRDVGLPDGSAGTIKQDSYALLGVMASYEIDPNWSVSANLNNLTNEKYLSSLYWEQGFYGAPRNASMTLSWAY